MIFYSGFLSLPLYHCQICPFPYGRESAHFYALITDPMDVCPHICIVVSPLAGHPDRELSYSLVFFLWHLYLLDIEGCACAVLTISFYHAYP